MTQRTASYKALVAELLAETLHKMSMDIVKIIHGYTTYPIVRLGAAARPLLVIQTNKEPGYSCWDVACDADNRIWVSNRYEVLVYNPEGTFLYGACSSWASWQNSSGIAFGPNGEAYVTDYEAHCIQVCRPDGSFVRRFGSKGTGPGQMIDPGFVAVDSKRGIVFVSEMHHGQRVQVLKLDGSFVRFLGDDQTRFGNPYGVAVNAAGEVGVVHATAAYIEVFDECGRHLRKFGGGGTDQGAFRMSHPTGLAVDSLDNWFVSDSGNHRVQVFTREGTLLTAFGESSSLYNPLGLCVDYEGRILVVANQSQVCVFAFGV